MGRVATIAIAVSLAGCCFGLGNECDPGTYVPHCTPAGYDWCWQDAMLGSLGGPARIEHSQCGAGNQCLDLGSGQVGCAATPFTPCTWSTFVPRCDGDLPVFCFPPSNYMESDYEVHGETCREGTTCSVVSNEAVCTP